MRTLDLNADLGESFGPYQLGDDRHVLEWVTSANVACGFHAGDPHVMRRTINQAVSLGVALGAHPGFADLQGFGRRLLPLTAEEVYDITVYQVGAAGGFARAAGAALRHVKPHGALYNHAARDPAYALAVARAVRDVDRDLLLFAPFGSELYAAGQACDLDVAAEGFADRSYESDGSLTPRTVAGALITDEQAIIARALRMVKEGALSARTGETVACRVDTVCLHGDGTRVAAVARALRMAFEQAGIGIAPPHRRSRDAL